MTSPQINLRIRQAEINDLAEIARLEASLFSDAWSEQAFAPLLTAEHQRLLCAELDGKIIGYGVVGFVCDEGEIQNLGIDFSYRRRGYGKLILTELLRLAQEAGAATVFLEVRASNLGARRLYESVGFTEIGVRRRYYHSPSEDAVLMAKTDFSPTANRLLSSQS